MQKEIENEVWRDVEGYEGIYQVSDLGRVRSLKFGKVRVLRASKNGCGYLYIGLHKDRKIKTVRVHRLVAQAFIPNSDEGKNEINHINEDKTDNRASNLEWCDRSYNLAYNGLHHRRKHSQPVRDKVKDLYRPDLSIAQNIELFKEQGIECSERTVIDLRKELGISKPRKKTN